MLKIILIRHTQPAIKKGVCYGKTDLELATNYREGFQKVLGKLKLSNQSFEEFEILSSPLKRCVMLAGYLSIELNTGDVEKDDRLVELDFGDWELMPWLDIEKQKKYFDNWCRDYVNQKPPNGESLLEVNRRFEEFYQEIIAENLEFIAQPKQRKTIIIVTHQTIIRLFVAKILSISLRNSLNIQTNFSSISGISYDRQLYSVEYVNR